MINRWRRHRHHAPPEMNITAFMNLMVILVPFLLMTAVFSRLAIQQLELPDTAVTDSAPDQPDKSVTVIVRKNGLILRAGGVSEMLANKGQGHDLTLLNQRLRQIKNASPELTQATILLEPDVAYDLLIHVMDAVRSARVTDDSGLTAQDLFPDIAIGDASPGGDGGK